MLAGGFNWEGKGEGNILLVGDGAGGTLEGTAVPNGKLVLSQSASGSSPSL